MPGRSSCTTIPASLLLVLGFATSASAATYYVRPDGGTRSQCTGLANAQYPGSGSNQACAWDHPFRALPPGGPAVISGGDTLIIGAGSYMIGLGAPGSEADDTCSSDWPWDCIMAAVPSGVDSSHPTRILGEGWSTGCTNPPELWGTERVDIVLNLTDASHVAVECLEITDHSDCVEDHSGGLACERDTYPYGSWAARGLYAEDSTDVVLRKLDIHGLAATGVHAGRLSDWTVEDVRIAGNGWAGWDGDLWEGDDSSSGTLTFRRWTVEWNGCAETYPGGEPTGCWAQSAGGYGDGVGTGATQGNWIIEDSAFLYNTSDGLDLLYAREGSTIEIRRTIAAGNAGNQIKTNGPVTIENSIVVGSCGFFSGQAFTYNVDDCRAAGNALALTLRQGDQAELINSTVTSQGDCLVLGECDIENSSCDGSERLLLRNNIFVGHPDFLSDDLSCLAYQETFPHDPFDIDYSIINGVKNDDCPGDHDLCGVSPGLVSSAIGTFDAHLLATSPAIDAGTTAGAPSDDFDGLARDAQPDIGAYEYRTGGSCSLSCSATVPVAATIGTPVTFQGSAAVAGCNETPAFDWDFGDGSPHGASQSPVHTFTSVGTYTWRLTVVVQSVTCPRTGTIVVAQSPATSYRYLVPAVAHAPGVAGTQWRTDLAAVNRSGLPASLTLSYYSDSPPLTRTTDLDNGAAVEWRNLLQSLFGLSSESVSQGTLSVDSTVPVAISSRTYNQTQEGTFGQYLPALTLTDAMTGEDEGLLPQLRSNDDFRTNIGLVNLGAEPQTARVRLFGPDGTQVGATRTVTVAAGRWTQINDIFQVTGAGSHDVAYATVTAGGENVRLWAYASVVDNTTGDPTTVPVLLTTSTLKR